MTSRSRLVGATFVAVLFAASCGSTESPASDCDTVREMLAYNDSHSKKIEAETTADTQSEVPVSDYSAWASELQSFAARIANPDLASHANRAADLAVQTVRVVEDARNDLDQPSSPTPPSWVQKYGEINLQFKAELNDLNAACPA